MGTWEALQLTHEMSGVHPCGVQLERPRCVALKVRSFKEFASAEPEDSVAV